MKQVRFAAFLFLIVVTLTFSSLAQVSQSSKPEAASPPAANSQDISPQATMPDQTQKVEPSGSQEGRIKIKIVPRQDKRNIPWQLPDKPLVPGVSAQGTENRILNLMPRQSPGDLDPGIYLQRMAGTGTVCGSIVSYNFSPGENPILESVTKCTPTDGTAVRRTDGQNKKPAVPQFREIKDTPPKQ